MVNPIWSVLCQRPIVDEQTQSSSYVDCINELFPSSLPRPLPQLFIVSQWEALSEGKKDEFFYARYTLLDPEGQSLGTVKTDKIKYTTKFVRIAISFTGTEVKKEGRHRAVVEYKEKGKRTWKVAADIPLYITVTSGK